MTLSERRLELGSAAVLSPSAAAELLPWGESRSMAWLEDQALIRTVPGMGRVVIWGEALAAIKTPVIAPAPVAAAPRGSLPRADLTALRSRGRSSK